MTGNERLLVDIVLLLQTAEERMREEDWKESGPTRTSVRRMIERINGSIIITD